MKKVFVIILIVLISSICKISLAHSINYPLLAFGLKTYSNSKYDNFNDFYFDGSYTDSFVSVNQKINDYFSIKHEFDFIYKSDIKKAENLSDLQNYIINNKISFNFKNKYVKLQLATKPIATSSKSEFFFKQINTFSIKITPSKYFSIETSYQNSFLLKESETMTHKIQFNCCWYFEKMKFIKFKSSTAIYLQNGMFEKQNISPLKKITVNFYCAIDFNKTNFETIFNDIEDKFKEYDDFD